ncbi:MULTISPECIES: gamma-glutamyltransferase family protein [unclassified Brevundimonas]|uniref:gamma-glutamyltransferase family protein n=1 Tax=unclassified Brevundimonas TaxID=2622653 RepID=UPI0006F9B543|nr:MULTISPECIES: gamma-glutamyltransferase family protein [unclassified Brevundimonas]KQY95064.1 gamma-glutamyltransferase [Brevundimonas sp. Root1423]KRA28551.1 gamma-glutamyltransferase [Brevundimonas sp. Root608]
MNLLPTRSFRVLTAVVATALALAGCAGGTGGSAGAAPVPAPAPAARGPFVAAANPLAVEAGLKVLREGGSAVDAAVAIQAVLGLVEPQSSGLGGGAFMMVFDAATGEVTSYDGRETAPAAATPELFYEDGRPLGVGEAILSGRSTGAPGAVAMLAMAQRAHGRLPWSALFGDAERLARDGFVVSPRLAGMIAAPRGQARSRWANAYFTRPDGARYAAGDVLRNPAYAETVAELAAGGADAFYNGRIAREIAAAVAQEPRPGALTTADIAAYAPVERGALCRPYRIYVVCVPPPPSSGVAVLQLLAMAERTPDVHEGPGSVAAWTAFAQLQRLMYADRDRYVGDPGFVGVPVQGLLDPDYVAARAALAPGLTGAAESGTPPGGAFPGPDATREPAGTSHFVVVDARGNAVSMTTTVESVFGSGRMAAGFFINNQLTDFSFTPVRPDGAPAANAVAAGKRPRSSMSPVLILDRDGRLLGALGSPGGPSILAYNARALIAILDWGLPVQAAFDLPNLVARGDGFGADTERFSEALRTGLAARGVALQPNASENSGLHGAMWRQGAGGWAWDGGADDRREGVARTQ